MLSTGDGEGLEAGRVPPGKGVGQIFYEKKIDPAVKNMLLADSLNHEAFLNWWCSSAVSNDFWIEHPERLVRVHVIPRKSFFHPRKWQTQYGLRDLLLHCLGPGGFLAAVNVICLPFVNAGRDRRTRVPDIRLCGLAAVFSVERPCLRGSPSDPPRVGMASKGIWKMNKVELQSECFRRQIPTSPAWSVLKLRTILANDTKMSSPGAGGVPKKLTGMTSGVVRSLGIGRGETERHLYAPRSQEIVGDRNRRHRRHRRPTIRKRMRRSLHRLSQKPVQRALTGRPSRTRTGPSLRR